MSSESSNNCCTDFFFIVDWLIRLLDVGSKLELNQGKSLCLCGVTALYVSLFLIIWCSEYGILIGLGVNH